MEKRIKVIIMIMMFLVVTACGHKETEIPKTNEEIVEGLRDFTVMIYSGEVHGTGVVIGNDDSYITIATVSHVIGDNNQGIVTFNSGKTAFADVVYKDVQSDICILKINNKDFADNYSRQIAVATTGEDVLDSMEQNDKIFLVGSAVNVAVNATVGEVGSTSYYIPDNDLYMIYLYADAMAGMSGSGCYDAEGRLIGIVAQGSDNSEVLCIRINDYLNVLKSLK